MAAPAIPPSAPFRLTQPVADAATAAGVVFADGVARGASGVAPWLPGVGSASLNRAFIQAALDAGGAVTLSGSGTLYVSGRLVIGSNTRLIVSPLVTVKALASNTMSNLLVSRCHTLPWVTTGVSIAWTAGLVASLTLPAHGLSVGSCVWTRGVTATADPAYFGCFEVQSVTDANTVVIRLRNEPSAAPSGAIQAKAGDTNIRIEGGTWDSSYTDGNTVTPSVDAFGIVMAGVKGLTVRGMKNRNCQKYLICFAAVSQFELSDVDFLDTNSDGIKIYGPAFDGNVLRISGTVHDDFISLQPEEGPAFAVYDFNGGGSIIDVDVQKLDGNSTTSMICLYPHPNFLMDAIKVDGVSGTAGVTFARIANGLAQAGLMGKISMSGLQPTAAKGGISIENSTIEHLDLNMSQCNGIGAGRLIRFTGGGQTYVCKISGLTVNRAHTGEILSVDTGASIRILELDGISISAVQSAYAITIASAVDRIIVRKALQFASDSATRFMTITSAATVREVSFQDCILGRATAIDGIVNFSSPNFATVFSFDRGSYATTSFLNVSQPCSIVVDKIHLYSDPFYGIVRTNGAAVTLRSMGSVTPTAKWISRVAGTEQVTTYGDDITIDVATAFKVNGARAFNTNAALSCGVGVVISDGAAWKNVYSGATY